MAESYPGGSDAPCVVSHDRTILDRVLQPIVPPSAASPANLIWQLHQHRTETLSGSQPVGPLGPPEELASHSYIDRFRASATPQHQAKAAKLRRKGPDRAPAWRASPVPKFRFPEPPAPGAGSP